MVSAAAVLRALDADLLREELFELLDEPRIGFGVLLVVGIGRGRGGLLGERADEFFGLTHREPFLDAALQQPQLLLGGSSGDRFGVAHRDEALLERQLHLVGQLEQTQVVDTDERFLPTFSGKGVLREVALVDQALHAERDLDGVEVLTLDVLHERHGVEVLVVDLADVGREGLQIGATGGRASGVRR